MTGILPIEWDREIILLYYETLSRLCYLLVVNYSL